MMIRPSAGSARACSAAKAGRWSSPSTAARGDRGDARRGSPFDCVLSDVNMPELDGYRPRRGAAQARRGSPGAADDRRSVARRRGQGDRSRRDLVHHEAVPARGARGGGRAGGAAARGRAHAAARRVGRACALRARPARPRGSVRARARAVVDGVPADLRRRDQSAIFAYEALLRTDEESLRRPTSSSRPPSGSARSTSSAAPSRNAVARAAVDAPADVPAVRQRPRPRARRRGSVLARDRRWQARAARRARDHRAHRPRSGRRPRARRDAAQARLSHRGRRPRRRLRRARRARDHSSRRSSSSTCR